MNEKKQLATLPGPFIQTKDISNLPGGISEPFLAKPPQSLALDTTSPPTVSRYVQPNADHKRNVEDGLLANNAIWGDEFGLLYGSHLEKGVFVPDFDQIVLIDRFLPPGVQVYGMLDDSSVMRVQKTSHVLRQHGLPTEAISRIHRIIEVTYRGKVMPFEEARKLWVIDRQLRLQQLQEKLLTAASVEGQATHGLQKEIALLEKQIHYLNDAHPAFGGKQVEFYILERDVPTNKRLLDVWKAATNGYDEMIGELKPFFRWLKAADDVKRLGYGRINVETARFDEDNPEDVKRYLFEWLPTQMGTFLAKFHNLGLRHGYAHIQNWIVSGALVDLDSVRGEILGYGDTPTTPEERQRDVDKTIDDLAGNLGHWVHHAFTEKGLPIGENQVVIDSLIETFMAAYEKYRDHSVA